jgi:hypothetical protein
MLKLTTKLNKHKMLRLTTQLNKHLKMLKLKSKENGQTLNARTVKQKLNI